MFGAPWQGRVFALALTVVEALGLDWEEFRQRLISAINAEPERPYWESWTAALQSLLLDHGIVAGAELPGDDP